ncbi:MAG: hypothetical protein HFF84_09605 [Oscillibacter sp.]|nr:hypothetical protein [Oscillibacter sp.]
MKLYNNDAYRDEFMGIVYGILHNDGTNDWANQIIDAFDNASTVEAEPMPPNASLTLEELRDMDGEPVWIAKMDGSGGVWMLVDAEYELCREAHGEMAVFENCGKTWLAYRRKPEEGTI